MAWKQGDGEHVVRPVLIEWDGQHLPDEWRQLPPGRYYVESITSIDDPDDLTPEEEAGIQLALDEIEAGRGIPLEEAIKEIRSRIHQR